VRLEDRARHAADGIRRAVEAPDRSPSPAGADPLERFERFRERRQRAQRLRAVALTFAILVVAGAVVWRTFTSDRTVPASAPTGSILYGDWDPKTQQAHWYTITADGAAVRDLGIVATCAQWWPDGSRIFVTNDAAVSPGSRLRPATIRPDGSGLVPLDAAGDAELNLGCGDVSPDGARIALEGFGRGGVGVNGIYTVRASDGGDLVRLTDGHDSYPQYAPGGDRIVFLRTKPGVTPSGAGALFVADADGGGLRRITPWGFSFLQVGWSPDGKWIVFERPYGRLYLVHPDGSDVHPVPVELPAGAGASAPQWSPDGQWIVFTLQQGSNANIFVVRPDGTGLHAITHVRGAQETSPDWTLPPGA
jgi:Tol biopolymer transport system component